MQNADEKNLTKEGKRIASGLKRNLLQFYYTENLCAFQSAKNFSFRVRMAISIGLIFHSEKIVIKRLQKILALMHCRFVHCDKQLHLSKATNFVLHIQYQFLLVQKNQIFCQILYFFPNNLTTKSETEKHLYLEKTDQVMNDP